MHFHRLILAVLLLTVSLLLHAEPLAYKQQAGTTAYQYDYFIDGKISMPHGKAQPFSLDMRARLIDTITAVKKDLASVVMTIQNGAVDGASEQGDFSKSVPDSTIAFDRLRTGEVRNLHYTSKPAKAKTPIPGLENAWVLFSRFGHHFQLPGKELKTGQGWSTRETIGLATGTAMALFTQNKLTGVKVVNGKRYLKIDSKFKLIAPQQKLGGGKEGGQPMTMDVGMTGATALLFDQQAGRVFRSMVHATLNTKAAMPGGSGDAQAMTGTFTLNGTARQAQADRLPSTRTKRSHLR